MKWKILKTKQTLSRKTESKEWTLAHERAKFKISLTIYVILNLFLWTIWYLRMPKQIKYNILPWPIWPMLGWGLGLTNWLFQSLSVQHGFFSGTGIQEN